MVEYPPIWTKVMWYIGTIGFVIYFAHRFQISEKREKLIIDTKLINKISGMHELADDQKDALGYILGTLVSSRERWNYIFIFVTSTVALLIGIYIDFLR